MPATTLVPATSTAPTGSFASKSAVDPFASVPQGVFAASTSSSVSKTATKPAEPESTTVAIAKYSRQASGPTEISIEKGDVIQVINTNDKDWWYGKVQSKHGNPGYFPSNYVELRGSATTTTTTQQSSSVTSSSSTAASSISSVFASTLSTASAAATAAASSLVSGSSSNKPRPVQQEKRIVANESYFRAVAEDDTSVPVPENCRSVGLSCDRYACKQFMENNVAPLWKFPFILDLFADPYKTELGVSMVNVSPISRLRSTLDTLYESMRFIDKEKDIESSAIRASVMEMSDSIRDLMDTCRSIPEKAEDNLRFYTFLVSFIAKIRSVRVGTSTIVPLCWSASEDVQHAILLVIRRESDAPDGYTVTIVNTNAAQGSGIEYHVPNVSAIHGTALRRTTFELKRVSSDRIQNTIYWFALFRSSCQVGVTFDAKYIYERLLPFLSGTPIQATLEPEGFNETSFRPLPMAGDESFVHCIFEAMRVVCRAKGLSHQDTSYATLMVKYGLCKVLFNDIMVERELDGYGKLIVELALEDLCREAATFANYRTGTHQKTLLEIHNLNEISRKRMNFISETYCDVPYLRTDVEIECAESSDLDFWGRFRRDVSVEKLAGVAPPPPIIRPVEMTLVPDRVSNFQEMAQAMRHCLNLCVLLSNQRDLIRNSYTLRFCLIEHLFVRVIPLPMALKHPDRATKCFWHNQSMRYETQADILRLLNMLSRHFATASLSIKITRSADASRMLVFASMATMCDVTMRKIASDIPAQSSLHYSGMAKGPVKPFGFGLGNFDDESEYLKFVNPESASARTMILDYFHDLHQTIPKENLLFRFNEGQDCMPSDKKFIDQLCLQMGFLRGQEKQYITGVNRNLLDHYPEIGFFRDLIFMFKLVMAPSSDQLPELKAWTPEEAALNWSFDEDKYVVRGFNRSLECAQAAAPVEEEQVKQVTARKGFFRRILRFIGLRGRSPRSLPSQANPSILLGERVDTEDDILHIMKLPDFDGTLGAKDCELMLQYLTAPYLRIPLLLTFFSNEVRLKALRNVSLQEVLDAALFEPSQWQEEAAKDIITKVPADAREHLCSPVGLLFNELIMSPTIILTSIQTMLERVIDMDTGKYSALSESILYTVRLVVKVESYILFLVKNRQAKAEIQASTDPLRFYGASFEADVRGLQCSEETLADALVCQQKLRSILNDQVFKIFARWIKHAKDEGQMHIACKLHAHLAYLYRNIDVRDLNATAVFAMLACQIFLFNNYRYNLDLDESDAHKKKSRKDEEDVNRDLGIPQIELFGLFQLNRNKIMDWLLQNPDPANEIMNALVEMVEESESEKLQVGLNEAPADRKWVSIEQAGINFKGRFVPQSEYDPEIFNSKLSKEARVSFEAWLREVTTIAVSTEINVQLGEFTIKKHVTQPLDSIIADDDDFLTVFANMSHNDIIQCAEVKNLPRRKWLRLVGLNHDVQYWVDGDSRVPLHGCRITYGIQEPPWSRCLVDAWIERILPGIELYVGPKDIARTETATYYGFWMKDMPVRSEGSPPPTAAEQQAQLQQMTLKEIVVHKYPRFLEVFNIVEYGRRWYRTLVFSTAPQFSVHDLRTHAVPLLNNLAYCGGDPSTPYVPGPSVIIWKYPDDSTSFGQMFLPARLFHGTLPDCLLQSYQFWQEADDHIQGIMTKSNDSYFPRSRLRVTMRKFGSADNAGFGFSQACATVERMELEETGEIVPNSQLLLLNTHTIFNLYGMTTSDNETHRALTSRFYGQQESATHAILRTILRLDALSNILVWSKTSPADANGSSGHHMLSIDVIELPRLRLTFKKTITKNSEVLYLCVEQPGYYLCDLTTNREIKPLVQQLPNAILMKNDLGEYAVLMSAIAKPAQYRIKRKSPAFRMVFSYSDPEWIANCGEVTYFMYSVHISNTRLQSKSIAATFYLLIVYFMMQNYADAFQLISASVCDRALSAQEAQLYEVLQTLRDRVLVNSAACRLKLFFVTYGCSDHMKFQYNIEEDMQDYVSKALVVSSHCRLNADEELFLLSKIPEKSRTVAMINRERIMSVSFDSIFKNANARSPVRNFTPVYAKYIQAEPYHTETLDYDALTDVDRPTFKTVLQKLSIIKYTKPDPVQGQECMAYLSKVFSKEKNVGFFFLYELMGNFLPSTLIPDVDKPASMASVLLHVLPDSYITGLQRLILLVMETHPHLATQMPPFKDERRLKLPTFAGLDVFQSHIKAAASYLKTNKNEVDTTKFRTVIPRLYVPANLLVVSPAVADCAEYLEGRMWFRPTIRDYTCTQRAVSMAAIPSAYLTRFHSYLKDNDIATLTTSPLLVKEIETEVGYLAPAEQAVYVGKKDPARMTVLNHPASRSHIARTSLTRLQEDMRDFYTDINANRIAFLRSLPLDLTRLEALNAATAFDEVSRLQKKVETIRNLDVEFAVHAMRDLVNFANGKHALFQEQDLALGHILGQDAGYEMALVCNCGS